MDSRSAAFPAVIVALATALSMGAVMMAIGVRQADVSFVNRAFLGLDHLPYYEAAERIRAGGSPYEISPFVTPPLSAVVMVPLTAVPFEQSARIMVALVPVLLIGGYWLLCRQSFVGDSATQQWVFAGGAAAALIGYPYLFLFERANIDAVVMGLLCLAVLLVRRYPVVAGAVLAVSVSLKLYPVLALVPWVMWDRRRAVVSTLVTGVVLALPMLGWWGEFFNERLRWRAGDMFAVEENVSIYAFFHHVSALGESVFGLDWGSFANVGAPVAFVALFAIAVTADVYRRRADGAAVEDSGDELSAGLLYFPFMVAIPKVSYSYESVIVLFVVPALCWYWARTTSGRGRGLLWVAVAGIVLVQVQSVALGGIFESAWPFALNAAGLFLMLVFAAGWKVHQALALRVGGDGLLLPA